MNEEALFAAYRNTLKTPAQVREEEELAIMRLEDRHHATKCIVGECPTMIADWTGRVICRFHEGKRRRGEL